MKIKSFFKSLATLSLAVFIANCGGDNNESVSRDDIKQDGVLGTWEPSSNAINETSSDGSKVTSTVFITESKLILEVVCHFDKDVSVVAEAKLKVGDGYFDILESKKESVEKDNKACRATIEQGRMYYTLSDDENTLNLSTGDRTLTLSRAN